MELAPNPRLVEVAKAPGGSFKLAMLAPRTVREMTQLPKETQKNGDKQVFLANHLAKPEQPKDSTHSNEN